MSSERLPGKALKLICEQPMLNLIIERMRLSKEAKFDCCDSDHNSVDVLEELFEDRDIKIYRANLEYVDKRYLDCARQYSLDYFVRVCGDRPFQCASMIDEQIRQAVSGKMDLVTHAYPRAVPPGLTVETFSTRSFENALDMMSSPSQREHIADIYYEHPSRFQILSTFPNVGKNESLNLVVDTAEDLERLNLLADKLSGDCILSKASEIVEAAHIAFSDNLSAS